MKVAVLSPVAWRTPPRHYGPWEQVASNLMEGLVQKGIDATLFATKDSLTTGKLKAIIPRGYEEDKTTDAKVAECMHISYLMECASEFDLIHNHFDFLPLTYSPLIKTPMVTTIHGFSSPKIIAVYKRFNAINSYISISNADRSSELTYTATVYNGLKTEDFTFRQKPGGNYLLFLGRIHPDKGTWEAIQIALKSGYPLIIAGIIQDRPYFDEKIAPYLHKDQISFIGEADPRKRDELLGNAYALLHPIRFAEPFGLSVAEAMLCGTPVIAFNKGSMPELILDNKTGFLTNSIEEAVEKVTDVTHIRRDDCHRWAKSQFSREKMVEDYFKIYNQILKNS